MSDTTRVGTVTLVTPTMVLLDGDSTPVQAEIRVIHPDYLSIGSRVVCTVRPLRYGSMQVILVGVAGGVEPPLRLSPPREWWWGGRGGYGPVDIPAGGVITPPGAVIPGSTYEFKSGATYRFSSSVRIGVNPGIPDGLAIVRLVVGGEVMQESEVTPARLAGDQEVRALAHLERSWKALADATVSLHTEIYGVTGGLRVFSQLSAPYSALTCLGYGAE